MPTQTDSRSRLWLPAIFRHQCLVSGTSVFDPRADRPSHERLADLTVRSDSKRRNRGLYDKNVGNPIANSGIGQRRELVETSKTACLLLLTVWKTKRKANMRTWAA